MHTVLAYLVFGIGVARAIALELVCAGNLRFWKDYVLSGAWTEVAVRTDVRRCVI